MGMSKTRAAVNLGGKPSEGKDEAAPAKETKPTTKPTVVEDHSEEASPAKVTHAAEHTDNVPARTAQTAVATTARAGQDIINRATSEPDGFEDLDDEIGFGSFPILTLSNGTFMIGDEDVGKSLDVILQQSRRKHLYKEGGVDDTDFIVYSYDEEHDTGGKPLAAIFDEWVEEGVDRSKIEHKKYSEAVGLIISETHKGEMILLSVPPASIKRFAGYRSELKVIRKKAPQQVVTRLLVGPVIKKDTKKFNPWNFKYVRPVNEADLEAAFNGAEEEADATEE